MDSAVYRGGFDLAARFVRRLPGNSGCNLKGDVIVTDFVAAKVARGFKNLGAVVLFGLLTAGLGGCETSSSLFGGGPSASNDVPSPAAVQAKPTTKVAFSPVIGAPDAMGCSWSRNLVKPRSAIASPLSRTRDRPITPCVVTLSLPAIRPAPRCLTSGTSPTTPANVSTVFPARSWLLASRVRKTRGSTSPLLS